MAIINQCTKKQAFYFVKVFFSLSNFVELHFLSKLTYKQYFYKKKSKKVMFLTFTKIFPILFLICYFIFSLPLSFSVFYKVSIEKVPKIKSSSTEDLLIMMETYFCCYYLKDHIKNWGLRKMFLIFFQNN